MARDYPAFLFYPEDFEAGTAEMSNCEVGMYIRLLCHQWHKSFIPDEPSRIGLITRASADEIASAWPVVRTKFQVDSSGQLRNARLEQVRENLVASSKRRVKAGKKGAKKRWHDDSNAIAKPIDSSCLSDGKNMPSRVGNVNETVIESESDFDKFWSVVPNKTGKRAAEKAYKVAAGILKMRGEASPHGYLLERMTLFAASPIGRGETKFIPHPSTWLNNGRYDDDPLTWRAGRRDPRGTINAAEQYLQGNNGNQK